MPFFSKNSSIWLGSNWLLSLALIVFLSACGGGGGNDGENQQTDTIAPVITLNGNSSVTLEQGESYIEMGASAIDDRDGVIKVVISGSVDTNTPGSYTLNYRATDSSGNSSEATRKVNVVAVDTTPPVITLNGDSVISLMLGQSYVELGATAVDDTDGAIDVVINGNVDSNKPGSYILNYEATDSSSNTSSATRTVNVIVADTTPPVITLNGVSNFSLNQGEAYVEAGATAVDDTDGTINVMVSGNVDTNTVGTYTLIYSATDSSGNSSNVSRTVNVIAPDTTPPVITLNGESSITLIQGDTYVEAGATAVDERDGTVEVVITNTVDTETVGTYTLIYSATDSSGNASNASRTVSVITPDTTPPVITLNGESSITLIQGDTYVEAGANAVDERDGTVEVVITNTVDTETVGTYTLIYSATDNSDNSSEVTRTVDVLTPDITPPEITLNGESSIILIQDETYVEAGALALDERDGIIDVMISGNVDTTTVGSYSITYSATDFSGNESSISRTIDVIPDTIPPIVALNGDARLTLILGDNYVELGATAVDNRDGNVDVIISGSVDTSQLGLYQVTYSATDSEGNEGHETRAVNVVPVESFITIWKTDNPGTSNLNQLKIGTAGNAYNYSVDWGDGSFDAQVTGDITHTFASAGTYTVIINGAFPRIFFDYTGYDNEKILSVEHWGNQQWQSMENAFYNCKNLVVNALDIPDLSLVTSMKSMFIGAEKFNQNINDWDVSSVTNMQGMFQNASQFNQPLDNWDVSSVTSMNYMFLGAFKFNQDLGNWNVSKVTNLSGMFFNTRFNQDISSWNVAQVNNMSLLFTNSPFNQDISGWDISSVTNMYSMFGGSAFNQDISGWDVVSVTNMWSMFSNNATFDQDISGWDVSKVTLMNSMFEGASAFNQDLSSWDVSKVTGMENMFRSAVKFNQPLHNWNVGSVNSMYGMFRGATLFNQDLSNWNVSKVTRMPNMFKDAINFDQDISSWDVSQVWEMTDMFKDITLSTANYDALLQSWSAQPLQNDVLFNAGNSTYSASSQSARDTLSATYNWTVTDGGVAN